IVLMIRYFRKTEQIQYVKQVYFGSYLGIGISLIFGLLMYWITTSLGSSGDNIDKLWESVISLLAVILITTLIYYMIKNKGKIAGEITSKIEMNLSMRGILVLAALLIAREGAEVTLFILASADKFSFLVGSMTGIIIAVTLGILISKSLVKVNLSTIFNITLLYLILQAGFLFGYSFHEFISYFKGLGVLNSDSFIFTKLFDLSGTYLDHKESFIGILLYALVGWYSKPEIIQFLIQYLYTGIFLYLFLKARK
ncbi:MAG: FTR1 family protein, partial [Firmicutes bacterium]|nr:FTR1 family protein [Bacillota bacterium]